MACGECEHLTMVSGPAGDVVAQRVEWLPQIVKISLGAGDDEEIDVTGLPRLSPGEGSEYRNVGGRRDEIGDPFIESGEQRHPRRRSSEDHGGEEVIRIQTVEVSLVGGIGENDALLDHSGHHMRDPHP